MPVAGEPKIRLLAVDDHPLMQDGLALAVSAAEDMELVAQATSGEQGIALFQEHTPDIVLMDLRLPDMSGVDAIRRMRSLRVEARYIVLTTFQGDARANLAIQAGATGYLLKATLRNNLIEAIRTVFAGGFCVPPEVAQQLARHLAETKLTEREVGILKEVAAGCSNKVVADHLAITEDTVKGHIRSILTKLKANDRTHAVMIAIRRGYLELQDE